MVPPQRIELRTDAYKATVIPFNYKGKNLVQPLGIEPSSSVLQTGAMTTFAKVALVLSTRIELVIHPYQGCVIPLNYESKWCLLTESNCRTRCVKAEFYH